MVGLNKKGKLLAFLSAGIVLFSLFVGLFIVQQAPLTVAVGAQGEEEGGLPFGGPKLPIKCPTSFRDVSIDIFGMGSHPDDIGQAMGNAVGACQVKYREAEISQESEANSNEARCESVQDCTFSEGNPEVKFCHVDNSFTGCLLQLDDQGNTILITCKAKGSFNRTGYNCKGPVKQVDAKVI